MMTMKTGNTGNTTTGYHEAAQLQQRVEELEETIQTVRANATALKQHHARLNRLVLDYKRRREAYQPFP